MSQSNVQSITSNNKRYPDVVTRYRPGKITDVQVEQQAVTFTTEHHIELVLQPVTSRIIHLRYYMEGDVRTDFSYAVDPGFIRDSVDFRVDEQSDHYRLATDSVVCVITKDQLLVHFYDTEGKVLCEDQDGFYRRDSLMKGISEVKVTKKSPEHVRYYGLGDKACDQDLRGRAFENWNTDAYAYKRGEDPLYRSIPFYMALIEERGYGIFFNNTYRTRHSFDRRENGVSSFSAEGGIIDYYFIYGPELTGVAEQYARLTGIPELPPMWALGYHQCRWSYYPESRVRELAQTFRDLRIPCDAIYLDIDYMDEYRCFTWNTELFPDPKGMVNDLKEQGFETVVMINPGIKADREYSVYREGMEKGYFCRRPDGEVALVPVWPQKCAFPDFTRPEVRDWWARLYKDFLADFGISGVWNDMNEPAVFEVERKTFPDDIRHDYDGHPCSHKKGHNIYGMQMANASLGGIKQAAPDKRSFLLTRANFSGGQRYASLWTGDNIATWDHLKLANEQCQRLSISGYSFVGSDVGGFVNNPGAELFTRWLQLSVFHPLFRNHAMGYNVDGSAAVVQEKVEQKRQTANTDQEPWSFGDEYTAINRTVIKLRYRLLSYLYTAFKKYIDRGTPVIRPLSCYDQTDSEAVARNDEFLFGAHILVAPVLDKGRESVEVYLPQGSWYHFWDHDKLEGKKTHKVEAPLEQIPFFIRAGTVLPLREIMQYAGERTPGKLELHVYCSNRSSENLLYEDAGDGYGYREGDYLETTFRLTPDRDNRSFQLIAERDGVYTPPYKKVHLTFIGLPFSPAHCIVDGKEKALEQTDQHGRSVHQLTLAPGFKKIILE